jgi:hypothetical protein
MSGKDSKYGKDDNGYIARVPRKVGNRCPLAAFTPSLADIYKFLRDVGESVNN